MKLIVTSDIHWDVRSSSFLWKEKIKEIISKKPDFFVICGDIAAAPDEFEIALKAFSEIPCKKFYVLGNHDIWVVPGKKFHIDELINIYVEGENLNKNSSNKKYDKLCLAGKNFDFQCLESNPFISDKFAFVGNMGWYDFGFVDKEIIDLYPKGMDQYSNKIFPDESTAWGDGKYAKWGNTDKGVSRRFAKKLTEDFAKVVGEKEIFLFTHHAPLQQLVKKIEINWGDAKTIEEKKALILEFNREEKRLKKLQEKGTILEDKDLVLYNKLYSIIKDLRWNMGGAFIGARVTEKVVLEEKRIKKIFFGHTHHVEECEINGIKCYNCGSDYENPKYIEVEI